MSTNHTVAVSPDFGRFVLWPIIEERILNRIRIAINPDPIGTHHDPD